MERRLTRYGVCALLLQGMALAACDQGGGAPDARGNAVDLRAPAANAASQVRPVGPERLILAFGDSLYAGYGLAEGEGLPDQLQARLRADGINATVVKAGVSGDTTGAGRQRLVFTLDNLPRKPDLVVLGLGGNDALRQISPGETRANMIAMLDELSRRGVPVVLTGMVAPPNLGEDYARAFNAIWPDLARTYRAALYPFILDGVVGDASLMLPDGIHPNAGGVVRITNRLEPIVAARLGQATAPRP